MERAGSIELQLGDHRLPIRIQRVGTSRSRHSHRPLTEIHGLATTTDPWMHQQLSRVLQEVGSQTVRSVERFDNGVGKWCVSWNSYAESDGEHRYSLILREEEELSLQALLVGGIELHPYEYREEFSEAGELTIWAKLVGSKQSVLRLRALLKTHPFFPVIRRGIHDEPREMRFGVAEWSEHQGQIKFRMVLVDRDADPTQHPELLRIEAANQRAGTAFYMNFVERLAELLERRGVLPAAEIEAAREAAREELWQGRHEFWRVPDVDLL
ncbi:MAG TPA: hypothetical protein VGR27_11650 [Longimicrobiaceae bacterium]|nr:hypothetical protein [Longimicrobiaceae bacterium]